MGEEAEAVPVKPPTVAVLVDYWNAYRGALAAIQRWRKLPMPHPPPGLASFDGHFNPVKAALLIAGLAYDDPSAPPRELILAGFYRGVPDQKRDRAEHAHVMKQIKGWLLTGKQAGIECHYGLKKIVYDNLGKRHEKGVDAHAAAGIVAARARYGADVVVLFSGDNDLAPALVEAHLLGARCEIAAWAYGDRQIKSHPFIKQTHMLGPSHYAQVR